MISIWRSRRKTRMSFAEKEVLKSILKDLKSQLKQGNGCHD